MHKGSIVKNAHNKIASKVSTGMEATQSCNSFWNLLEQQQFKLDCTNAGTKLQYKQASVTEFNQAFCFESLQTALSVYVDAQLVSEVWCIVQHHCTVSSPQLII